MPEGEIVRARERGKSPSYLRVNLGYIDTQHCMKSQIPTVVAAFIFSDQKEEIEMHKQIMNKTENNLWQAIRPNRSVLQFYSGIVLLALNQNHIIVHNKNKFIL